MAEANASLAQSPTIRIITASRVLAMSHARNAVKRELQKQGLKVSAYSARDITSWAGVYLDDHASELIPPAIEQAKRLILSGALGKRAARALAQAQ
jgi:hypothetical protein